MKYILMLNDMRSPNIENLQAVKVSTDRQELIDFHNSEKVEPYSDEGPNHPWHKAFRKGGPLEWFNPVMDWDDNWAGGIYQDPNNMPDEVLLGFRLSKMTY